MRKMIGIVKQVLNMFFYYLEIEIGEGNGL